MNSLANKMLIMNSLLRISVCIFLLDQNDYIRPLKVVSLNNFFSHPHPSWSINIHGAEHRVLTAEKTVLVIKLKFVWRTGLPSVHYDD